jgi:hypothetical protein
MSNRNNRTIIHARREQRAEEHRLRVGIVRAGALLGWDASTAAAFVATVTGRPLSRCGRADLLRVLDAYLVLAGRVRAAQARQHVAAIADGSTP